MKGIVFILLSCSLLIGCSTNPKAARDKYFDSGMKYLEEGHYEEAIIQFRNALQVDQGHVPSYLRLAEALRKLGDHKTAVATLGSVLKLDGKNVEAKLNLANYILATSAGDRNLLKKAREMMEEILEVNPSNIEARITLGKAHAGLNDADKAIRAFEEVLTQDPINLTASLNLAAVYLRQRNTEKAEGIYRAVLKEHPDSAQAHLAMANFCMLSLRSKDAELYFRKAFELAPADSASLYSLVSFYLSAKRKSEAESVFREAIAQIPGAREPRWGLANFYIQSGQFDKGITILTEMLTANPHDRQVQLRLAELYLDQSNEPKAEEMIRAALAIKKNDAMAHYLMGKLMQSHKDMDGAMAEFETAIQSDNSLIPPYLEKAKLLLNRNDIEGAYNTLNAALDRDKNYLPARAVLANVLLLRQMPEDALGQAQTVLATMPDNTAALTARSEAFRNLGRLDDSKKDLLRLCERDPGNAQFWHRLGNVEAVQGDSSSALSHLRRAVELKPDFIAAINDIVYLHLRDRHFDAALTELEKLFDSSAPQDEIHRLRGQVYIAEGDEAAAEHELREAIEANPQNYPIYLLLGQLNQKRNNIPQALKNLDSVIAKNPKYVPAFVLKAFYMQISGDVANAIVNYRKVLALDSENVFAANNLAWLLCESNTNLDEALDLARKARKKAPSNPEIADTLGWIYYKKKLPILAVDQLVFSVYNRKAPAAENYYRLGMAYYAKGDIREAKESLKRSLELKSNYPGANEAQEILNSSR
jgi:tetratricopeptide (TPR) repeat protein